MKKSITFDFTRQESNKRQEMYEVRRGLKQGLDVSVYAKPELTGGQMDEIREGLKK